MSALQMPVRERTDWRPAPTVPAADVYETSGSEPTLLWPDHLWTPVAANVAHYNVWIGHFVQVSLMEKAWLEAFTRHVTTVPRVFVPVYGAPEAEVVPETPAQKMAAELRRVSGLTNEEIAPLLGVSRRSLQSWIAGDSISARKEARLRAVLDAIRQLAAGSAVETRERLLARAPHSVRAYDLLAEERYEAAIDLALGRRRPRPPQVRASEPLDAQLDRIEDIIAPAPRLNRKLSRPLKR